MVTSLPPLPAELRRALVARIARAAETPGIRAALVRTLDPAHPTGPQQLLDDWTQGWPARPGRWMLRTLARERAADLVRLGVVAHALRHPAEGPLLRASDLASGVALPRTPADSPALPTDAPGVEDDGLARLATAVLHALGTGWGCSPRSAPATPGGPSPSGGS